MINLDLRLLELSDRLTALAKPPTPVLLYASYLRNFLPTPYGQVRVVEYVSLLQKTSMWKIPSYVGIRWGQTSSY